MDDRTSEAKPRCTCSAHADQHKPSCPYLQWLERTDRETPDEPVSADAIHVCGHRGDGVRCLMKPGHEATGAPHFVVYADEPVSAAADDRVDAFAKAWKLEGSPPAVVPIAPEGPPECIECGALAAYVELRCEAHRNGSAQRRERATAVWYDDPEFLKRVLTTIAGHPRCPKPIYDLAADALCWARKFEPATADPAEALAGLLDSIRAHQRHECPGITPKDCLDAIYEAAEIARHALPSSCPAPEGGKSQ